MPTALPSVSSLERIVPDTLDGEDATGADTYALHAARYAFAAEHVGAGRVLDCACGVGYGSAMLADAPGAPCSVLGVDVDPAAVAHAAATYARDGVGFAVGDGATFSDAEGFETIVSLETVEHVAEPARLLANFADLLRPGGTLVASVPVTPSVDVNPYHLHDFTARRFRALGASLGLKEADAFEQTQPFDPVRIASGREVRLADMRQNLPGYYLRNPKRLLTRAASTILDGFNNKYLTVAWRKPS